MDVETEEESYHERLMNRTKPPEDDMHESMDLGSKISLGIGLGACCAIIILGNCLVIAAIGINKKLRTVTNYFVFSLALADLTLGVFVLPFSLILQLEKRWLFGETFCSIWAAADVLCCTASILSLCAISVDRYIGVTKPLKHRNMSKRKAYIPILAIWGVSIIISIVGPLLNSRKGAVKDLHAYDCSINKGEAYALVSATCSFYIPALVIIIIYIRIYNEAKKQYRFLQTGIKRVKGAESSSSPLVLRAHSKKQSTSPLVAKTAKNGKIESKNTKDKDLSVNGSDEAKFCEKSDSFKDSKSGSNNNLLTPSTDAKLKRPSAKESLSARLVEFNNETKAAKTLGIVVGVFLLCWFPFFLILPIDAICKNCVSRTFFDVVFWLGYCNSMLNPMIYALRMGEFKKTFINILCCQYGTQRKAAVALLDKERPSRRDKTRSVIKCPEQVKGSVIKCPEQVKAEVAKENSLQKTEPTEV